jgi:hypothetical protein
MVSYQLALKEYCKRFVKLGVSSHVSLIIIMTGFFSFLHTTHFSLGCCFLSTLRSSSLGLFLYSYCKYSFAALY